MKNVILLLIITTMGYGCVKEIQEPTNIYYLYGTWKMKEIVLNGNPDNSTNISSYRISFNADSTYSRTTFSGVQEKGKWKFTAANTKIVLTQTGSNAEEAFLIIALKKNILDLEIIRESSKTGNAYIQFRHIKE